MKPASSTDPRSSLAPVQETSISFQHVPRVAERGTNCVDYRLVNTTAITRCFNQGECSKASKSYRDTICRNRNCQYTVDDVVWINRCCCCCCCCCHCRCYLLTPSNLQGSISPKHRMSKKYNMVDMKQNQIHLVKMTKYDFINFMRKKQGQRRGGGRKMGREMWEWGWGDSRGERGKQRERERQRERENIWRRE